MPSIIVRTISFTEAYYGCASHGWDLLGLRYFLVQSYVLRLKILHSKLFNNSSKNQFVGIGLFRLKILSTRVQSNPNFPKRVKIPNLTNQPTKNQFKTSGWIELNHRISGLKAHGNASIFFFLII